MAKRIPYDEEDILLFWFKDNPEKITCAEDRYSILSPEAVVFPKDLVTQTHEEKMKYIGTCLQEETPMKATYLYKSENGELVDGGKFSCQVLAITGKSILNFEHCIRSRNLCKRSFCQNAVVI